MYKSILVSLMLGLTLLSTAANAQYGRGPGRPGPTPPPPPPQYGDVQVRFNLVGGGQAMRISMINQQGVEISAGEVADQTAATTVNHLTNLYARGPLTHTIEVAACAANVFRKFTVNPGARTVTLSYEAGLAMPECMRQRDIVNRMTPQPPPPREELYAQFSLIYGYAARISLVNQRGVEVSAVEAADQTAAATVNQLTSLYARRALRQPIVVAVCAANVFRRITMDPFLRTVVVSYEAGLAMPECMRQRDLVNRGGYRDDDRRGGGRWGRR